jgi:hypothetical protein
MLERLILSAAQVFQRISGCSFEAAILLLKGFLFAPVKN